MTTEDQERPAHWEYEENEIDLKIYDMYSNIEDINAALTELAGIIGELNG